MNSSYVLIIINPFPQDSDRVRARPPAARVSLLCCQSAARAAGSCGIVFAPAQLVTNVRHQSVVSPLFGILVSLSATPTVQWPFLVLAHLIVPLIQVIHFPFR